MELFVKCSVNRSEGKQMSAELVGEALVAEVEQLGFDVEDSLFEVDVAEIVDNPKARPKKVSDPLELGAKLLSLADAYMKAFPLSFGDDDVHVPTAEELQHLHEVTRSVFLDDSAAELARDAQVRAAILKSTDKQLKKRS